MVQGLGTALCEGYIYDQQGRLLNPSFTDNKIPTARDIPPRIESMAVETAQLDGPFGAVRFLFELAASRPRPLAAGDGSCGPAVGPVPSPSRHSYSKRTEMWLSWNAHSSFISL